MRQKLLLTQRRVVRENKQAFGGIGPEAFGHHVHLIETEQVVQAEALVHCTIILDDRGSLAKVRDEACRVHGEHPDEATQHHLVLVDLQSLLSAASLNIAASAEVVELRVSSHCDQVLAQNL